MLFPVLLLISDSILLPKENASRQQPPINKKKADEWIFNSSTPAVALQMTPRAVIQGVGHQNALTGPGAI